MNWRRWILRRKRLHYADIPVRIEWIEPPRQWLKGRQAIKVGDGEWGVYPPYFGFDISEQCREAK